MDYEPNEEIIVAQCSKCGEDIYANETYGVNEHHEAVCRYCVNDEWDRLTDDEKFSVLGFDIGEPPEGRPHRMWGETM